MNGILINYEYCTGCHSCEVACKKVHDLPKGQWGIKLMQDGPRQKQDGSWEFTYLPLPTSLCDLCAERVSEGRLPSCVHHCQAGVMRYGEIGELSELQKEVPRSAVFAPLKA